MTPTDPVDSPSAAPPAPESTPSDAAAADADKPRKKKRKVRNVWISFAGRILAQVIGAAASVALGVMVVQRIQKGDAPQATPGPLPATRIETPLSAGEVAIAVLPLDNFSASADDEYFADGMTEALIAELAQIKGLHVISRTSTMKYKVERKSMPEVAQDLDVDYVVEGSVARASDRVRVTAQLIAARKDEHIWAKSYDRRINDVLTLQAEVATAIAGELKGVLTPGPAKARRPVDPVVYDLYLRGRHAWNLRSADGIATAVRYFTQATEKDPEFALAYAGLADAYSLQPAASATGEAVNFPKAKAAAQKAIQIDDNLAEAHTSLGGVYFFGERNLQGAAREFERAVQLNSHYPTAHQWYAILLAEQGKSREALAHAKEAVADDPLSGVMHQALGLVQYYGRQYEDADRSERRALQLNAQLPLARLVLAKSLILQGKPQDAIGVCRDAPTPGSADILITTAIAHARAGDRAAAEAIVKDLEARSPRPAGLLAQWHAANGNYDAAFALLNETRGPVPAVLSVDPLFEGLRADARFAVRAARNTAP